MERIGWSDGGRRLLEGARSRGGAPDAYLLTLAELDGDLPRWFQERAEAFELSVEQLQRVDSRAADPTPDMEAAAEKIAIDSGATPVDDVHVVAALLFNMHPAALHRLFRLGFDVGRWRAAFLASTLVSAELKRALRTSCEEMAGTVARDPGAWSPGAARVSAALPTIGSARELFFAVVVEGWRHRTEEVTAGWMARQLGSGNEPGPLLKLFDHTEMPAGASTVPAKTAPGSPAEALWELAARLALGSNDGQLHVRHVIGALLLARDATGRAAQAELAELLNKRPGELPTLQRRFDEFVRRTFPIDRAWWDRWLGAEPNVARLPGYQNDGLLDGTDQLNLNKHVDALAAVIAARSATPPLAIGLFGEWGTGKSFFMRLLERRIATLAAAAGAAAASSPARDSPFCRTIRQVRFNAWHYIDANLWASLAGHLFGSLSRPDGEEESETKHRERMQVLSDGLVSVKEKQRAVAGEQEIAREQKEALTAAIAEEARKRDEKRLSIQKAASIVEAEVLKKPVVASALAQVGAALGWLPGTIDELRAAGTEIRGWAGVARQLGELARRNMPGFILVIVLVILPIILPLVLIRLRPETDGLVALLSALGGVAAGWLPVLRHLLVRAREAVEKVRAAMATVSAEEARERRRLSEAERELVATAAEVDARISALEDQRRQLAVREQELENEGRRLADGRSLSAFVAGRAASDDYSKHTGLIAMLHRDLEQLSARLRQSNASVDRIVLYIDDLDRCPARLVVQVLEAVHLLLAFELFVVVVGVDSRWLLRALEEHYAGQFRGIVRPDDHTPLLYLEKIFQVPYVVPPMDGDGFERLLRSVSGNPGPSGLDAPRIGTTSDSRHPVGPAPAPGAVAAGSLSAVPVPASPVLSPSSDPPASVELVARALALGDLELQFMSRLRRLVGTPRAAKRLVNLYRIVKAVQTDEDLERFLAPGQPGIFEVTLVVLATSVGWSTFAASLLDRLEEGPVTRVDLISWLREVRGDARFREPADALRELDQTTTVFVRPEKLSAAARLIARFSLRTALEPPPSAGAPPPGPPGRSVAGEASRVPAA